MVERLGPTALCRHRASGRDPRDRVVTIDLEIDLVRRADGRVEVLDHDEFEQHRQLFGYPATIVGAVTSTIVELTEALASRRPPFLDAPQPPPGLPREP
jgi:uncharacterized protein